MGAMRDSLETSLSVAVELEKLDPMEHAALIAGARAAADALDADEPRASMLSTYLNYCKMLGVVPAQQQSNQPVVGSGKLATVRSKSRLRAV